METAAPANPIGRPAPQRFGLMTTIVAIVVTLDQFTKWHINRKMHLHESIPIIPDVFNLTYIRNSGAAFGILAGNSAGFRMVFFAVTSVLALAMLGAIYARLPAGDWVGQSSVASIFGGALGNLIDRIRLGEVIDFLDFSIMGYHWPAFNVADTAITVGVGLLMGHFFMHPAQGPAPKEPS